MHPLWLVVVGAVLVGCSPGTLEGEYGFEVGEAWLLTCVQEDGTPHATALVHGTEQAAACSGYEVDTDMSLCDSWVVQMGLFPEMCHPDTYFGTTMDDSLELDFDGVTDLQDMSGVQATRAAHLYCAGLDDDGWTLTERVWLEGSYELSDQRRNSISLILDSDDLYGEVTLQICEG